MLAYILGITKRGNKGITNLSRFYGLQIRARGITNRGSLRDFKSEQKDYKSGRSFKLGQRDLKSGQRLQIGAREITNRSRDFNSGQGLQIGAEHNTTVFEYSESEYCPNSKVGLWKFYHSKATKGYNGFSVPAVKWSKTVLYVFESRVTKNQRNVTKLVLCLC